jgi:hypothetical protein
MYRIAAHRQLAIAQQINALTSEALQKWGLLISASISLAIAVDLPSIEYYREIVA